MSQHAPADVSVCLKFLEVIKLVFTARRYAIARSLLWESVRLSNIVHVIKQRNTSPILCYQTKDHSL